MDHQNRQHYQPNQSYQPQQQQPPKKQSKFKQKLIKIDAWLKAHPRKSMVMLVSFIVLSGAGIIFALSGGNFNVVTTPAKATVPERYYSQLTGKEISEPDSKRPVTAVMIENSPEARPQSGLAEAGVVFESVAEGGITRFLALYQEDKPGVIGPVRSVRPHYASLVAPFDAGLAHVGGSEIPLKKLRSGKIRDLDQFFNPESYRRATDRFAPHNVYTSTSELDALNKKKNYKDSDFLEWAHLKKAVAAEKPNAKTISVPVSTGLFAVDYTWNKIKNEYVRSQGGATHTDREKGAITPEAVIVMQVPHDVIRDSNGYSYPDVNTKGKAWLFQNGTVKQMKWSKKDDKSMIQFTDSEGEAVKLRPGRLWVTLIKPSAKPTWK